MSSSEKAERGTFSDGKLNTAVKDVSGRNTYVLQTFVEAGAPEEILYLNKPHIGTDVLKNVVKWIREEICRLGGEVRFKSQVTDLKIKDGALAGIIVNDTEQMECQTLVLAVGHSARDTFEMLAKKPVLMEQKAFAAAVLADDEAKRRAALFDDGHVRQERIDFRLSPDGDVGEPDARHDAALEGIENGFRDALRDARGSALLRRALLDRFGRFGHQSFSGSVPGMLPA